MNKIPWPSCDWALALCLLCPVLLLGLSSARAAGGMPTIRRVAILDSENGIEVEITSSQPVAPQTRVLSGPDRIVIDFPGAVPAGHLKGLTVNQGGIKAVRAGLFESNPPVTRVVLDLAAPSEYQLVPSGNTIIVKLGSAPVSVAPEPRGVLPPLTPGRLSAPNVKVDFEREKDFGVASRQLMLLSPIVAPPDVSPATTGSQVKTQDVLLEAQRLRDVGDFNAAAKLLRTQIAQKPDDGEVARLLAQTLYWHKDIAGAQAVYDTAFVQHPEDTTLRLQYGRMLAETGKRARARELLSPLLGISATRVEAETLLGMLAYWDSDLTTARRFFDAALESDPNHQEEARRLLREILTSTAPWVRISSSGWHDDQPLNRLALGLEAGWFPTPLTKLSARVQPMQYWIDGASRTVGVSEIAVAHYAPQARLETELAAGSVLRAQNGNTWDWTGRAVLGFRLPGSVTLRGRIERTPYLYTKSSLDTPVMVQTAAGLVHWDDQRGWLGEAAYQQEHYPDDNTIRTEYGWLLAPVVHHSVVKIQAGYALSASNANQSRFVLAQVNQPYPPGDPRFNTAGIYAPYYTPSHLVTHSAIAAFTLEPSRGVTLHLNGSYAVRATDDAPFLTASGGQAMLSTYARSFFPWNVRASLAIALGDGLTLEPTGEVGHTAFYSWATGGLQITYHFKTARGTAW